MTLGYDNEISLHFFQQFARTASEDVNARTRPEINLSSVNKTHFVMDKRVQCYNVDVAVNAVVRKQIICISTQWWNIRQRKSSNSCQCNGQGQCWTELRPFRYLHISTFIASVVFSPLFTSQTEWHLLYSVLWRTDSFMMKNEKKTFWLSGLILRVYDCNKWTVLFLQNK